MLIASIEHNVLAQVRVFLIATIMNVLAQVTVFLIATIMNSMGSTTKQTLQLSGIQYYIAVWYL